MICEKYQELTPIGKIRFIGCLVHAVQSDDSIFDMADKIIQLALLKGYFEGVKINTEEVKDEPLS